MKALPALCLFAFAVSLWLPACEKASIETDMSTGFTKFFGQASYDDAGDVKQTSDGGYVIAGAVTSKDKAKEIFIAKLDKYGNSQWERNLGGALDDLGNQIIEESDGYVVAGMTTDAVYGQQLYVIKVSLAGNIMWEFSYGDQYDQNATCILSDGQGGYIVGGTTNAPNPLNQNPALIEDIMLLNLNSNQEINWMKIHGGASLDLLSDIEPKPQGGYLLIGTTRSFSEPQQDKENILIIETNPYGVETDKVTYGGNGTDVGGSITITSDGKYLFAGSITTPGRSSDIYVGLLDANLHQPLWLYAYGGTRNDYGIEITETQTGYALAGSTESAGVGSTDMCLLLINTSGSASPFIVFGSSGVDRGAGIDATTDNGYVLIGTTEYEENRMIQLVKTDKNGKL